MQVQMSLPKLAALLLEQKSSWQASPPGEAEAHALGQSSTHKGLDAVRQAARLLGAEAALGRHMDQLTDHDPPAASIDVVDIFCGCGGVSAGFRAVSSLLPSYRIAGALDIDPFASKTYARNFGIQPLTNDIVSIERDPAEYQRFIDSLDRVPGNPLLLIGCAPCQGFSSYRNKVDQDDRNSLISTFAKLAVKMQPEVIFMENVPELMTQKYWGYFENARSILAADGYIVKARVYNLAEFGVPQERFRVAVVAMKKQFNLPESLLPREKFRTVRDAIGGLPGIRPGHPHPEYPLHVTAGHKRSTVETIARVPKNGGNRPMDVGPESLRRAYAKSGKPAFEDVYGRLPWDKPAITITASSRNPASGRFVHPEQDRGLSVLEAALLQSFPSNFTFEGPFDNKFLQVGNAVPPKFAAFMAAHLLGELFGEPLSVDNTVDEVRQPIASSFSRLIAGLKRREGVER